MSSWSQLSSDSCLICVANNTSLLAIMEEMRDAETNVEKHIYRAYVCFGSCHVSLVITGTLL
jgi:hypothetical protein